MRLKLNNLSKKYDNKLVLNNINYNFDSGKIYCILGRNGVGKTTLFNIINGDIDYNGEIILNNNELLKKDVGFVPAFPSVPNFLTAREFVGFFMDINNIYDKSVDEYLDIVNIDYIDRDKLLKDFSYGMKSKIQLLINIMSNTKVLLLDEPLTSLDLVIAEEIKLILKKLKKNHIIVFTTHIMDIALSISDEIILLKNGIFTNIDSKNTNSNNIIKLLKEENYDK